MPDQLSWAEIRRLALHHRKALVLANLVAVLATLCSVPIPLLLPLLVDEVLLKQGDREGEGDGPPPGLETPTPPRDYQEPASASLAPDCARGAVRTRGPA